MNKELNAVKMAESSAKLATIKRLLSDTDLANTVYSQAFLVNQALNNIANAQILLMQVQMTLQDIRT